MPDSFPVHITRSSRKTIGLSIDPDGTVQVKAPHLVPKFFINQFIEKNRAWIEKHREYLPKKSNAKKLYIQGETFLFLGKEYTLDIGDYTDIGINASRLYFPQAISFRIKKEIEHWYIRQAKEIITAQTYSFAEVMSTAFVSLTFSDTKSQWGRCTHDNRLQFNWRLIMAPLLVVQYVVIHELAHTKEKNHSIEFWRIVRSQMPSYKQQIKWLKRYGNTLVM